MSKFKVKASLDNTTRTVEFERQKYDLLALRERTAKAFNVQNVNIRYTSSTNESFYITNDVQLQKAIKDVEKAGLKNLEVKVFKDTSGAPSTSAPAAVTSSIRNIPNVASTPAKPVVVSTPTLSTSGTLTSFRLAAIPNGPDRVAVEPVTLPDHFVFSVKPSKYDADIEVTLNGTTLNFLTTQTIASGQVMKGTQTITLPSVPTPQQIQVSGQTIKIFYR